MKNIKFNLIASALLSVALVGCNDMDTAPMGSTVTSEQKENTVAQNPARLEASVSAIPSMFSQFGNIYSSNNHHDFGYPAIMMLTDHRGMDLVSENSGYNWFSAGLTYSDIASTGQATNLIWGTMYKQIYAANQLIAVVDPNTTESASMFYLAQGLTIRAFDYFTLAQLYQHTYKDSGSKPCVPLILDTNADVVAVEGCARASVDTVYAQILADLNKAVSLLDATQMKRADKRYANAAVAYGLRARVNLVMNNWSAAAADATKAIELHAAEGGQPYAMAEVSKPGFSVIEDASWMWGVLVAETDRVVTTGICNFPSHMGSLNYGYASVGAWRMVNKSLYNSIPASDVRKGWFLDANGASANLSADQQAYATENGLPAYTQVKFGCYNDELGTSTNANDIPLMRVEEMYLIKAEAEAMAGNPSAGAATLQAFVQTYRDPQYTITRTTAEDVQNAVWQQRRLELWGEGFSYQDIVRLKKNIDRRGGGFETAFVFNIAGGDDVLVYPIPNAEIEGNPKLDASTNPVLSKPEPVADN